jgi:hypothetical protein
LQPLCDHGFVTDNFVRRHDIVLAEVQGHPILMKSLVSTPTCTPTRRTQTETELLGNRRPSFICWIYSFFQTGKGGFSFGLLAPVGDIQPEEVTIDKEGSNLYFSNIVHQFSIQRRKKL